MLFLKFLFQGMKISSNLLSPDTGSMGLLDYPVYFSKKEENFSKVLTYHPVPKHTPKEICKFYFEDYCVWLSLFITSIKVHLKEHICKIWYFNDTLFDSSLVFTSKPIKRPGLSIFDMKNHLDLSSIHVLCMPPDYSHSSNISNGLSFSLLLFFIQKHTGKMLFLEF